MRLIDADAVIVRIVLEKDLSVDQIKQLIEDIKQIPTSSPSWYCQECEHYYPKEQVLCPCDIVAKRKEDTGCG